ncbi:nuclear transport factor 2 family protein [Hydrogenophaga sp.]|uniref:nuclear transport factor 2 family protein n=1 Tax=Hydrogenophaga sp. TaxID=1904254 RepID=UPI00271B7EFF|nr:nuclear transport factor 2 family protein [Hydrogenophaga sp.]MDO9435359.1 nuclear transport factor 2 family protein [Hydrogenophaga sp.]
MDQDPYSIERLRDRAMIQDVIYQLCRAVDRRDTDAIRAAYHPDATDSHGAYVGGVEGYVRFSEERNRTIPFSMHHVSNVLIEFGGTDLALVETYLWSVQRYSPESAASFAQFAGPEAAREVASKGIDSFGCHRYVDRFERRDGRWRIAYRTVVFDWRTLLPLPDQPPEFQADWTVGQRTPADWLLRQRASMGLPPHRG